MSSEHELPAGIRMNDDEEALARFTLERKQGQRIITAMVLLDALRDAATSAKEPDSFRAIADLPGADDVTLSDVLIGLRMMPAERQRVDRLELDLIHAALDRGATLASLAAEHGVTPQAFGKRYRNLGGTRQLKPGRPKHTVTKYWVATAAAELDSPDRGEITLHRGENGRFLAIVSNGFAGLPGTWGSMVYLGELPAPGESVQGLVGVWASHFRHRHEKVKDLPVVVRAENVPLEPK